MARTTLLLLSILFLLPVNASVKKLQVEYLTHPIGLDITVPRFSWQLESAERGVKQIAYQITVATDAACSNTVWTSGKVASDKSLNICYAGPALAPSTRYYWKVTVWNNKTGEEASTEKAFFETGLLSDGWSGAQWIKATQINKNSKINPEDKKQAKEAYRKHLEGKKFLPGVFKQQNHIDEIKGVYVPFWIFDLKAKADFSYHAEKTRVWVSNDIEYTEHENFEVKRAGTVEFEKVPADGSKKMDDTLMESVEPYDFKEAVPFRMAYMAGYLADRYDVPKEECIGRAKKRIRRSTEREFRNTVKGYHVIDQEKANMEIKDQAKYALYPVWILNTTWKDKKYIFAMNGQTGKIVGDLPADNGAFWRFVAMWGAGIGLVLYALLWVFMVLL